MSYATYLQNKLAAQKKVVNVRNPTDASHYTHKKRLESTQVFFDNGQGVGSLAMDTSRPDGTPLLQHAAVSFSKGTTRPADASTYTAFRGHSGIKDDAAYMNGGRKELLCVQYTGNLSYPQPDSSKYKTAADATKDKLACDKSNALLDPPRFVDNTIRLSAMQSDMIDGCPDGPFVTANHTHSEGIHPPTHPIAANGKRSVTMANPPMFQNQGVGGSRIGAYYNPRSGYVEKKHGNDLGVDPKRIPAPFVMDPNAPAHLKINKPTLFNIKP